MNNIKEIRRLWRTLEAFRQHDAKMSISEALVLLMAADAETFEHQKDIEKSLNIANSTCSRYVSYWSEFVRPGEVGRGMLENIPDPFNRSAKHVRLLPKGRSFINHITDIIKGD